MSKQVCIPVGSFRMYMFLLIGIIIFITFIYVSYYKEQMSNVNLTSHLSQLELQQKVIDLQNQLYNTQVLEQKCQRDLSEARSNISTTVSKNILLDKIYNPLISPNRFYPGGRLGQSKFDDYQMIGYIYNNIERYPLFGRYKYPGKSDKWEYYIIDETRNRLKIPFKSKNDNELYDGDNINIDTLSGIYTVKIYDFEEFRYIPTY